MELSYIVFVIGNDTYKQLSLIIGKTIIKRSPASSRYLGQGFLFIREVKGRI